MARIKTPYPFRDAAKQEFKLTGGRFLVKYRWDQLWSVWSFTKALGWSSHRVSDKRRAGLMSGLARKVAP